MNNFLYTIFQRPFSLVTIKCDNNLHSTSQDKNISYHCKEQLRVSAKGYAYPLTMTGSCISLQRSRFRREWITKRHSILKDTVQNHNKLPGISDYHASEFGPLLEVSTTRPYLISKRLLWIYSSITLSFKVNTHTHTGWHKRGITIKDCFQIIV